MLRDGGVDWGLNQWNDVKVAQFKEIIGFLHYPECDPSLTVECNSWLPGHSCAFLRCNKILLLTGHFLVQVTNVYRVTLLEISRQLTDLGTGSILETTSTNHLHVVVDVGDILGYQLQVAIFQCAHGVDAGCLWERNQLGHD